MAGTINLLGLRFGKLTVVADSGCSRIGGGGRSWLCRCDCGTEVVRLGTYLRFAAKRQVISFCGKCIVNRGARKQGADCVNFKHGHCVGGTTSRTLNSFAAMRGRCTRPNNPAWNCYGGRGIKICKPWTGRQGFLNFLADMGVRPEGKTLDRKRVNGNYTPSNCRWATPTEQLANRRCSKPDYEAGEVY
jgi:hypothetical protein